MDRSLYEYILQNLKDDRLPEDFSLPAADDDEVSFADGAMDGMIIYHMGRSGMDAAATRLMIQALKHAAAGDAALADASFTELGDECHAINCIDDLQQYVLNNAEKLPARNVYRTAKYLILHSHDTEAVKYGLALLELFTAPEEPIKQVVRRLGLSDEFTIFAVWNMMKWDNGNEEVFALAQRVNGWGRIHAVERLQAQTTEIRRWLVMEGIQNNIMSQYSALAVWEKAGVADLLHGPLIKAEFTAIGDIIAALVEEGPVAGMSEIADPLDVLMDYLDRVDEFELEASDYETIQAINAWASDQENAVAITERCADILAYWEDFREEETEDGE